MRHVLIVLVVLSVAFESARAESPKMLPGLWEHNIEIKSQSGQIEQAMEQLHQQLESMPPEQRKVMQQMMASKGVALGGKKNSVKVCITEEQANLNQFPQVDENCTQEILEETSNRLKFRFDCRGSSNSNGEGDITFKSQKSFVGKAIFNTTTNGKPEQMTMQQSGTWQSAECGNIKPMKQFQ